MLWIRVSDRLDLGPFFWFGGKPGEKLPAIDTYESPMRIARDKKGARPLRKNHCLVPSGQFSCMGTIENVLEALFGELPKEMDHVDP